MVFKAFPRINISISLLSTVAPKIVIQYLSARMDEMKRYIIIVKKKPESRKSKKDVMHEPPKTDKHHDSGPQVTLRTGYKKILDSLNSTIHYATPGEGL